MRIESNKTSHATVVMGTVAVATEWMRRRDALQDCICICMQSASPSTSQHIKQISRQLILIYIPQRFLSYAMKYRQRQVVSERTGIAPNTQRKPGPH